ncbi:uncharacterized protein LOC111705724 [Eurytemora carolleeae]|uniref:uncharacterized protein LOC111705724 n=1 Tax=Eurytemora carolleeae TaxID=1294199 RepID=UPI000C77634F|nr:uncharacterized protein LOC111705724 [Eurytemora carolleeae]|eukprot:XP_023334138.1 uncharacterized protein LOC111705724 [Eurytemora affinis]
MLTIIFCVLSIPSVFTSECEFTQDCYKTQECQSIQDAGCSCRFGKCIISGHKIFGDFTPECKVFTDCKCSKTPETCFCNQGTCVSDPKEKWECHDTNSTECSAMKKCSGDKKCTCRGNLCEHECNTVEDCIKGEALCSKSVGYKCECKENLCDFVELPKQCDDLLDCIKLGKCTANAPCSCTVNQCTDPWYFDQKWKNNHPTKNCQSAEDCNYFIANCQNDKCTCEKMVKVDKYESWGECTPKRGYKN